MEKHVHIEIDKENNKQDKFCGIRSDSVIIKTYYGEKVLKLTKEAKETTQETTQNQQNTAAQNTAAHMLISDKQTG